MIVVQNMLAFFKFILYSVVYMVPWKQVNTVKKMFTANANALSVE